MARVRPSTQPSSRGNGERSRQRVRDQVAHPVFGAKSRMRSNAPISMMARSFNAPLKGRIQKRKTNHLQIIRSHLQRAAGPYRRATTGNRACAEINQSAVHAKTSDKSKSLVAYLTQIGGSPGQAGCHGRAAARTRSRGNCAAYGDYSRISRAPVVREPHGLWRLPGQSRVLFSSRTDSNDH